MKQKFILVLFAFSAFSQSHLFAQVVEIQGSGLEVATKVLLLAFQSESLDYVPVDSASASSSGTYSFKVKLKEPNLFKVEFDKKSHTLALEEAGKILLVWKDDQMQIEGSPASKRMQTFPQSIQGLQASFFGVLKKKL